MHRSKQSVKSISAVQIPESSSKRKRIVAECLGLEGKKPHLFCFSPKEWSAYLVPGAVGKAINVIKEPPAFMEGTQMEETGGEQRDTKYNFGS